MKRRYCAESFLNREVDDRIRNRLARLNQPSVSMDSLVNSHDVAAQNQEI